MAVFPTGAIHKPVNNFVWDVGTLSWVMETQPTGGGGGGGAVTIIDGGDVVEGSTTDVAITSDAAGTISAKLRGLVKWAYERMPAALGQALMAQSLPVVIATDQARFAVTIKDTSGAGGHDWGIDATGTARTRLFNADGDDVVVGSGHTLDSGFGILSLVSDGANVHGMKSDTDGTAQVDLMKVGGAALTEGQKAMAASVPVVIASDQSAVPVSGSVTTTPPANASTNVAQVGGVAVSLGAKPSATSIPVVLATDEAALPVTGPLTDAQLRATAVPVSGTVTATVGSLANVAVDPTGNISTDAYSAYRLQEKQFLTEVATSILSMLNDEISTSHRMGYEVR